VTLTDVRAMERDSFMMMAIMTEAAASYRTAVWFGKLVDDALACRYALTSSF